MNDRDPRPEPDLLEQAVRELRDGVPPPGPPENLIAATLAAIQGTPAGIVPAEHHRNLQQRKWIMRITKYGSLTVALAAAVALAIVVWTPAQSAADDVRKALRKFEQIKSNRVLMEVEAGMVAKMTSRMYYAEGNARIVDETNGFTVISNAKEKKTIMLFAKTKMYRWIDLEKDPAIAGMTKSMTKLLGGFKIPADDKIKELADEYLDGRRTKVYEIKDVEFELTLPKVEVAPNLGRDLKTTIDLKMWIDPKTDLPIKTRVVSRIGEITANAESTFLGFNEDLDPKLFELTIPEGFTEMK